jgi:hypothetical protein
MGIPAEITFDSSKAGNALGVVASLGKSRQAIVGEAFAYCEGARLYFGGRACERVEQLRLPTEMRLVDS